MKTVRDGGWMSKLEWELGHFLTKRGIRGNKPEIEVIQIWESACFVPLSEQVTAVSLLSLDFTWRIQAFPSLLPNHPCLPLREPRVSSSLPGISFIRWTSHSVENVFADSAVRMFDMFGLASLGVNLSWTCLSDYLKGTHGDILSSWDHLAWLFGDLTARQYQLWDFLWLGVTWRYWGWGRKQEGGEMKRIVKNRGDCKRT